MDFLDDDIIDRLRRRLFARFFLTVTELGAG